MKKLESVSQSYWKSEGSEKTYKRFTELIKYHNSEVESVEKILKGCEDSIRMKDSRIRELEERVEQLQSSLTIFITPEMNRREVLRLYAMGNSPMNVFKILTETKKIDIEYEVITDIIKNLKNRDLSAEDLEFYAKESKVFLENAPKYEEEYRLSEIRRILENQDTLDKFIYKITSEEPDEDKIKIMEATIKIMKEQRENASSLSKIMSGTNGSGLLEDYGHNQAKDIKAQLENKASAIVEGFDPSNIPMVGG